MKIGYGRMEAKARHVFIVYVTKGNQQSPNTLHPFLFLSSGDFSLIIQPRTFALVHAFGSPLHLLKEQS